MPSAVLCCDINWCHERPVTNILLNKIKQYSERYIYNLNTILYIYGLYTGMFDCCSLVKVNYHKSSCYLKEYEILCAVSKISIT